MSHTHSPLSELANIDRRPSSRKLGSQGGSTGTFFLRIIRHMAIGGINDARAASMLFAQFGRNHRRPLILIRALMLELARVSNRHIMVAPPCCGRITRDEALMLGALGRGETQFVACHDDSCALTDCDNALGAATCFQAVSACFADLGAPFNG